MFSSCTKSRPSSCVRSHHGVRRWAASARRRRPPVAGAVELACSSPLRSSSDRSLYEVGSVSGWMKSKNSVKRCFSAPAVLLDRQTDTRAPEKCANKNR